MENKNTDIRTAIISNNVRYWQVAEKLNISDCTLSKKLRNELSPEYKERILKAISEIKANNNA